VTHPISRRALLRTVGTTIAGIPVAAFWAPSLRAQGRCMLTKGSPACDTSAISPVFAPTGWKTVALDYITFDVADYRAEAAFYMALMGWTLRDDNGRQAVMDVADWGSVIFRQTQMTDSAPAGGRGAGRGRASRATVVSCCFVIDAWNAGTVERELRSRGLHPVAVQGGPGFEGFRVLDPDGYPVEISNGAFARARAAAPARAALDAPVPFESTGWKTVWLDHLSFNVTNYKESASFYMNLLGWAPTYDEGSQHELLIGDVGNVIVRGGNPLDPNFGRGGRGGATAGQAPARSARIDHISFGISPWDTDGVKAELERRGLRAQIDTSSRHQAEDGSWVPDDIHTAAFKSYHTQTPNGYNLQISYVTRDNRFALSNAVRPRVTGGG